MHQININCCTSFTDSGWTAMKKHKLYNQGNNAMQQRSERAASCRRPRGYVVCDVEGQGTRGRLTDHRCCQTLSDWESAGALTATRSMFMCLWESHCVGTCVELAALLWAALGVCVCGGVSVHSLALLFIAVNKQRLLPISFERFERGERIWLNQTFKSKQTHTS